MNKPDRISVSFEVYGDSYEEVNEKALVKLNEFFSDSNYIYTFNIQALIGAHKWRASVSAEWLSS